MCDAGNICVTTSASGNPAVGCRIIMCVFDHALQTSPPGCRVQWRRVNTVLGEFYSKDKKRSKKCCYVYCEILLTLYISTFVFCLLLSFD